MNDLDRVLASLKGCECYNVRPIQVTLGKHVYEGATFAQQRKLLPGCRAHTEAVAENLPTTYEHSGIVLIGAIKNPKRKYSTIYERTAFRLGDEDYYVTSYALDAGTPEQQKFRIGGDLITFIIDRWQTEQHRAIDFYEPRPYRRLPMILEYLD